jgi:Icc-related predicted phosphoesterase
MIIDSISDLHGSFPQLEGGDLLIIAGDLTSNDTPAAWNDFYQWLRRASQLYKKIVVVGGNHDKAIARGSIDLNVAHTNLVYLQDSGITFEHEEFVTALDGILVINRNRTFKIWGSPWTPWFEGVNPLCDAFMLSEEKLEAKFALIPDDTDILITHGPPFGILDTSRRKHRVGSKALINRVVEIHPKLHVFGHIHEGYGQRTNLFEVEKTLFVNCAHMNGDYDPVNAPIRVVL